MAASKWLFTKEQLLNTPSRKSGIDADKELSYRQQAANLIQDMGQRLQVTQLCINTAIVFMHRFYMFRSFSRFPRNEMAPACLFLAAKVEEQPRKLEHVIKVAHSCLHRDNTPVPDTRTEAYLEQAQQLVINENILLQTLGFEVKVDHPHRHVVNSTKLVNASKDLSQTSYYLATNSLHLTTFCLQYRPTVVACCCIYLACKWAKYMIPRSNEGREWFHYVDQSVTNEQIEELYQEFISILNKCPAKLKKLKAGSKSEPMGREVPGDVNHAPSPTPAGQHKAHTNHDRRESEHGRHGLGEPKTAHDHRDGRPEHHRDLHPDRRKDSHKDPHSQTDRKPSNPHHQESKSRKDNHREGRDGHPSSSQTHRKDAQHSSDQRERHHHDSHKREVTESKRESDLNGGQPAGSSSSTAHSRSHPDLSKVEQKVDSPGTQVNAPGSINAAVSASQLAAGGQKSKSETSIINYQEYMKRKKEREHQEREKREQERREHEERKKEHARREHLRQKQAMERDKHKREAELMNKTFSEGSNSGREQKHRPPKLDVSLPLMEQKSSSVRDGSERPYEVNIKSPIKPHHNITVKSPIKSSDLKQPKLEIPKVQLTPDKNGSDPTSVNINMDPAIRKLIKQEPGVPSCTETKGDSIEDLTTTRVKEEPFSPSNFLNIPDKVETVVKTEPIDKTVSVVKATPKEELEPGEIDDSEVELLPEHSSAPNMKIKELGYDPERGLDSAVALKHQLKHEAGSGRSTPATSQTSESGSNTPIKLKIKVAKGVTSDSDHSSSKHSSPHRHKHKHKEKHKHKHRDRDKHREKHHDKSGGSTSSTPGTNGQSLKMSFKLSDINKQSGSENWSVKQEKQKHKGSVSDPALSKHAVEPDRQQPWSLSSLTSISEDSNSRKRRRTPTVDQGTDQASASKSLKVGRSRSSSNHSVVSMEMSDGEEGGNMNGPPIQTGEKAQPYNIQQLNESIRQAIIQKKRQIESMQQHTQQLVGSGGSVVKKPIDRQQSGFDLDGMMWAGNSGDNPPLPMDNVAPPPPPPTEVPPPPPSH